jgi:polysaccharide pyruvyl transferase WcaK-like protein
MDGLGAWPLCELATIVRHAQRWAKPVTFVGTGTETLQGSASRHLVTELLAPYVAHWSVRSFRDRERLLALGVAPDRVTTAADMAWLLPPVAADFGQHTLRAQGLGGHTVLGVNVNAEHALIAREPRLFEKLAALLDQLIEAHRVRVVFLCNEVREDVTFDKAAAKMIHSLMRRRNEAFTLPNEYWAPQQMMSVIASCFLTISTRYHFCLFSALQNVPFFAIKRSDKVADLCEDLDWPFGAMPGSIDVEELGNQVEKLLDVSCSAHGLSDRVRSMRERAWLNRSALDALLPNIPSASRATA